MQALIEKLLARETIDAVVADGWPRPMVEAGFEAHRLTWNLDEIRTTLDREIDQLGGRAALEGRTPGEVHHIWPALPGAGITPMLYAALGGVERQLIKPSSRGLHFARRVAEISDFEIDDDWKDAPVIVVSGSDETVRAVNSAAPDSHVVGYGHRVSFAVVDQASVHRRVIEGLARDTVMWNQSGCFSLRGVVFIGDETAALAFARGLAEAIHHYEDEWSAADGLTVDELAAAQQRRGVSEFANRVFAARVGWVEMTSGPLSGRWLAPGAVQVHAIESAAELERSILLESGGLQGVAVSVSDYDAVVAQLEIMGATRICKPGQLQAPPASWPHDGKPNFTSLLAQR